MDRSEAEGIIRDLQLGKIRELSVRDSSNEIAGKLAKEGYSSLEWVDAKPGWRVYGKDYSSFVSEEEVWTILCNGECWTYKEIERDT